MEQRSLAESLPGPIGSYSVEEAVSVPSRSGCSRPSGTSESVPTFRRHIHWVDQWCDGCSGSGRRSQPSLTPVEHPGSRSHPGKGILPPHPHPGAPHEQLL